VNTIQYNEKPYFASFYNDELGCRLEKNDAMDVFESDGQAIQQCIKDALRGSKYALKQLIKTSNDPLVQEYINELGVE